MVSSTARDSRLIVWGGAAAVVLLLVGVPMWAPQQAPSAIASMSVSVTVVRPCSVSVPSDAKTGGVSAEAGEAVRLSCARDANTAVPLVGLDSQPVTTQVPGALAPAVLSSARAGTTLVLRIDF